MKRLTCTIGLSILWAMILVSCGGGQSPGPQGTLQLGIKVANSSQNAPSGKPSAKVLQALSISDFQNHSIASGPPDEFTIYIRRMELIRDGGGSRTIFDAPGGQPLRIEGSQIDLSSLFTNYACVNSAGNPVDTGGQSCPCGLYSNDQPVPLDPVTGKCPMAADITPPEGILKAETGAYSMMRITYFRRSQIKGCVTGNFIGTTLVTAGTHTYCTRAAFSTFNTDPGGQNANFENMTPELMDFDLLTIGDSQNGFTTDTSSIFTLDYPIKDSISIAQDGTAQLTLLLDVNRMLRFYNRGRTDQGPAPGLPTDRSYFFTSVFRESGFSFVGRPGSIRGYSFVTQACTGATLIPPDHVCTTGSIVGGWLTLATAADGSPLLAGFQPDDDNTLTVIKGSNMRLIGSNYVPDPSLITTNLDSTLNITFVLGTEGQGTVFNFNPDIAVGSSDGNAYFEGLQNSYGTLLFVRGL